CPAPEFGRDRTDIFAPGAGEIVGCMQAAEAAETGDHVLGDRAAIEGFRTFAANRFQGLGEFGLALDGAHARRFAVGEKGSSRIGIEAEEIALLADVIGDARRDRIALPRERDRWLERAFQRAAAVINDEPRPGLD